MEKIILESNVIKSVIQKSLDNRGVKYSNSATKAELLGIVDKYNKDVDAFNEMKKEVKKLVAGSNEELGTRKELGEKVSSNIIDDNIMTGDQFCTVSKQNARVRFFINKKYKKDLKPKSEWLVIFKKERLL